MSPLIYPFTEEDALRAYQEWGCSCGPAALAVCLGLTLDAVRPHLGDFERKRYMTPTLMRQSLLSAGGVLVSADTDWPKHGLVRIQWHGPWTEPGANPRWAYRQTHWTHSHRTNSGMWVFDINGGWRTLDRWTAEVVPVIVQSVPRADGDWHITHGWETASNDSLPKR